MLDQPTVAIPSPLASDPPDPDVDLGLDAVTQVIPVVVAPAEQAPDPEGAADAPSVPLLRVPARPLVLGALVVAITLAALHFGAVAIAAMLPAGEFTVPPAVRLNDEPTVATWFSSVVDLVNAALLAVLTATAPAGRRWRWVVATVAVLGVSIDEVSGFHEDVSWLLHRSLHTTGLLTYAWVVPALLVVAVVGGVSATVIVPRPGGRAVLIGGLVYVAGAAGVELLEGWWVDSTGLGGDNTTFLLLNGIEETMEMIGAIVAMAGLLRMADGIALRLVDDRRRRGAAAGQASAGR